MQYSNLQGKLQELKQRFTGVTDMDNGGRTDHWRILPSDGAVKGDCEDFSLTLAVSVYGSILKAYLKGARLVHCKYRGEGHLILKAGEFHCDNIQPRPFDPDSIKHYTGMKNVNILQVYIKLLYGKIFN